MTLEPRQSGKLSDEDRVRTEDDILHPRWAAVTFRGSTVASGKTSPVLSGLPGFSDKTERSRILFYVSLPICKNWHLIYFFNYKG